MVDKIVNFRINRTPYLIALVLLPIIGAVSGYFIISNAGEDPALYMFLLVSLFLLLSPFIILDGMTEMICKKLYKMLLEIEAFSPGIHLCSHRVDGLDYPEFCIALDKNVQSIAYAQRLPKMQVRLCMYKLTDLENCVIQTFWEDLAIESRAISTSGAVLGAFMYGLPGAIGASLLASYKRKTSCRCIRAINIQIENKKESLSQLIDLPLFFTSYLGWEYEKDVNAQKKNNFKNAIEIAHHVESCKLISNVRIENQEYST